MTIGSVNCSPSQLLASDPVTADARRSDLPSRQNSEANSGNPDAVANRTAARSEFVLGASAYRTVVATLESESEAAPERSGVQDQRRNPALSANVAFSYTGQRAQRSYQDAGLVNERESLSSLFGVDLFV